MGAAADASSLAEHLGDRYRLEVTAVEQLDQGVHRVDRRDRRSWVARVFPAARPLADVEAEAHLLQALDRGGFPAERCADREPVSRWGERAVLVTEFVAAGPPLRPGQTAARLGGLLGALHDHAGREHRPGGAWHHLSFAGGPREEIAAASDLLDDFVGQVPARRLAMFDRLRDAVAQADDCADLPHALVHPDCVPTNAIPTPDGALTIVDWTGAGRGPRLWSLGFLLWAAGAAHPRLIELVVSRYRRRITLEPEELARLEGAISGRPLMLDCWSVCHGRLSLDSAVARLEEDRERARAIADHAREAFSG